MEIAVTKRRLDDSQWMSESRFEDPARGPADFAVAAVEVGLGAGVVVRDHDADCDSGPHSAGECDRGTRDPALVRDGVPDAEARDDEGDLLFAGRRGESEQGEREETFLVEVPEGEEKEGRRECDRMKLVQRQ